MVKPKTKITFAGGINKIGSNKIHIESANNSAILLDFGTDYELDSLLFDSFMNVKSHLEIYSLIYLGVLPKPIGPFQGIYRQDMLKTTKDLLQREFQFDPDARTNITDLILSHPHGDHYEYIRFLTKDIKIHMHNEAEPIIDYLEGGASASKLSNIIEYKEKLYEKIRTNRKGEVEYDENGEPVISRPTTGLPEHKRTVIYHQNHEKFKDKNSQFEFQMFTVDHSIPGSAGYLITDLTNNLKIVYTGDFRLHGLRPEMTQAFVKAAKEFQPDILIIEGTRVRNTTSQRKQAKEIELQAKFTELFNEHKKSKVNSLIVIDTAIKNIDRIQVIFNAVKASGKKMVVDARGYLLLKKYENDKRYSFDFDKIYAHFPAKGHGIYVIRDYSYDPAVKELMGSEPNKLIKSEEIGANQKDYVVLFGFLKFNEFIEIKPNPDSIFIRSNADPFNDEMLLTEKKAINWLKLFKFKQFPVTTQEEDENKDAVIDCENEDLPDISPDSDDLDEADISSEDNVPPGVICENGVCRLVPVNNQSEKTIEAKKTSKKKTFLDQYVGKPSDLTQKVEMKSKDPKGNEKDKQPKNEPVNYETHMTRIKTLHCSGHVDKESLIEVINTIKPKILIPIHTIAPKKFLEMPLDEEIEIILPKLNHTYEFE